MRTAGLHIVASRGSHVGRGVSRLITTKAQPFRAEETQTGGMQGYIFVIKALLRLAATINLHRIFVIVNQTVHLAQLGSQKEQIALEVREPLAGALHVGSDLHSKLP